jgi:hypothetical protein
MDQHYQCGDGSGRHRADRQQHKLDFDLLVHSALRPFFERQSAVKGSIGNAGCRSRPGSAHMQKPWFPAVCGVQAPHVVHAHCPSSPARPRRPVYVVPDVRLLTLAPARKVRSNTRRRKCGDRFQRIKAQIARFDANQTPNISNIAVMKA